MNRTKSLIIAALIALAGACESKPTAEPTEPAKSEAPQKAEATAEEHAHAPAGYEPGSHDDWCGEHQVPESMCTRCNKSLIAGFKATGDWCDEHELPKSQCLACNPDLEIKRPPKEETQ